jgi:SanA protein
MKAKSFTILKYLFLVLFLGLIGIVLLSYQSISRAGAACFDDPDSLPGKKVGLLLGTSKYRPGGAINLYYRYRVEAAVRLFESGKVRFILISGDNATQSYNEPSTFRQDLIQSGIPAERIYLDYAGFRTLDSVVRCKEVFQEDDIIIISQPFHNERAVFIAQHKGLQASGFNAQDVTLRYGWKIQLREVFARVKTMLDLYVLHTQPRFLGEKIEIAVQPD